MKKMDLFWGMLMFIGFVGYFLIMRLLGLYENVNLRFFDIIIHFGGVYLAMKYYRAHHSTEPFSFGEVAMAGVRASIPAVLGFALFQFFYLRFIDPNFMVYLNNALPMGEYLRPAYISLVLIFEGALGTFFSAYTGMRLIAAQERAKFPSTL